MSISLKDLAEKIEHLEATVQSLTFRLLFTRDLHGFFSAFMLEKMSTEEREQVYERLRNSQLVKQFAAKNSGNEEIIENLLHYTDGYISDVEGRVQDRLSSMH